ncbi:MAG: MIP family channel protein [Bacteroidetes bacterium]|nr:MIP family channel protein [Bacteroidota bacterium]
MQNDNFKKYCAELFGTMVLVLMGCGSAVIAGNHIGFMGISLAFGLAVVSMAYTIGPISGCHINPAVTIAMLALGKINSQDALLYILFQCIGAIIGTGILFMILLGRPEYKISIDGLGQNGFDSGYIDGYNLISALTSEIIFTALFLVVIFATTSAENTAFAGLVIGLCLVLIHLVGIPVTGVSVNPARSIGPAIFIGGKALSQLWVYIIGPVVGGLLGALIWKVLTPSKTP